MAAGRPPRQPWGAGATGTRGGSSPRPRVLLVAVIIVYPIVYTVWMSLQEWSASSLTPPRFIGRRRTSQDRSSATRASGRRWGAPSTSPSWRSAAETLLGVAMALLFNREFWGRGLLRTLAILPMVATPTAIALVFVMMYHPTPRRGELPALGGRAVAVALDVLEPDRALRAGAGGRVAVDAAHHAHRAGRARQPAARALRGRPPRRRLRAAQAFWHITLPLLRPALVVAVLFRAIDALKTFDIIFVMTQGGPANASETINILLFNQAFSYFNMGYAVVDGGGALRGGHGRLADPDQGPEDDDVVRGRRGVRWLSTAGFYGLAGLFMLPTVFVFYWMITLSLKPQVEATAYPPSFVRFSVTAAGYREVFTKYPFFLYTWNSLVVAAGCTALGLAVGLPAAYSIARWRQQRLAVVILVARIIPGIAYLIPWYIFFRQLRMVDTYGALILTHLIVGLPIIIWVMISFFEDVPADLEDAALIDGCSYLGVFWRMALPLVKPGVVATAILSFVFSWNNFLFSVILAGR